MCVLLLSVSLPCAVLADSPIIVQEFGILCPRDANGSVAAPDTVIGKVDLIDDRPVDVHSTRVPAHLTLGFGVRYQLADGLPDQPATVVVTHPPMGLGGSIRQSWETTLVAGDTGISTYHFDRPDELVLGLWTIQIEIAGQSVMRQTFIVVPAYIAPTAIDVCFGGLTS
jgi:Domain of unknown function (DUF3859)